MLGERVQQQVAQICPIDLGPLERRVVRCVLLQQQGAVRFEKPHVLALAAGDRGEQVDQACFAQRPLAGVGVDVEHAALAAGVA